MDVVFILTPDAYYSAQYDNAVDKVTQYQKVLLSNVDKIEFGTVESAAFNISFGRSQTRNEHTMRIHYRMPSEGQWKLRRLRCLHFSTCFIVRTYYQLPEATANESGYFHMYRATNLRFFNNLAVVVNTEDERVESLKSIADSVGVAMELGGHKPDMWFGKLEKRKSRVPDLNPGKAAGAGGSSKVFLSMTSQFSKFNPMNKLKLSSSSSRKGNMGAQN